MEIKPFVTLLLSLDETYPGLTLNQAGSGYNVRWYKWGYDGPDYMDVWEPIEVVQRQWTGYKTVAQKFGSFPLHKRTELKKAWAEKQLKRYLQRYINGYYFSPSTEEFVYTTDAEVAELELKGFVLGLIDDDD